MISFDFDAQKRSKVIDRLAKKIKVARFPRIFSHIVISRFFRLNSKEKESKV